MKDQLTDRF